MAGGHRLKGPPAQKGDHRLIRLDTNSQGGPPAQIGAASGSGCANDPLRGIKRTNPFTLGERVVYEKVAATYFPAFYCSIIGAKGLNFSVRDGKR